MSAEEAAAAAAMAAACDEAYQQAEVTETRRIPIGDYEVVLKNLNYQSVTFNEKDGAKDLPGLELTVEYELNELSNLPEEWGDPTKDGFNPVFSPPRIMMPGPSAVADSVRQDKMKQRQSIAAADMKSFLCKILNLDPQTDRTPLATLLETARDRVVNQPQSPILLALAVRNDAKNPQYQRFYVNGVLSS